MGYKVLYFGLGFLLARTLAGQGSDSTKQSTHYLSKKISAGYGLYLSPRVLPSAGNPGINLQHEAFIEFAFAKYISAGFSAKIYHTISRNTRELNEGHGLLTPKGYIDLKGRNYALHVKFFKRKEKPWKTYLLIGATLNTFRASYDPDNMYLDVPRYSPNKISEFGPREREFRRVDLLIGNGISRTIANRLVLDFGYSVQVLALLASPFDISARNIGMAKDLYTNDYVEKTSAARVRNTNRFNLYFKIGYLF